MSQLHVEKKIIGNSLIFQTRTGYNPEVIIDYNPSLGNNEGYLSYRNCCREIGNRYHFNNGASLKRKTYKKNIFVIALLMLFSINIYSQNMVLDACYTYLKENGQSPEQYVISKFEQYDYVFLGEYHRAKQDVNFVSALIPDLYKNGIRNIAYEFYEYTNQIILDSLLSAKEWDEKCLYHHISKGYAVTWGYTEYLNLFKKVWEFNQTLEPNQIKFRVVLLHSEYNPCEKDPFGGQDRDFFMANVFAKEIVSKGEKALIYCGTHHAFTKYRHPVYDYKKSKLIGFNNNRMGNIIYKNFPEKTFTIILHSPWTSNKGFNKRSVKPVHGVIDAAMGLLNNIPMGFDVKNTIIGDLRANNTYYAFGYEDFKMEDFCDGYIFLLPYKQVEFVSVSPDFYDEYNLNKVKEYYKCRGYSDKKLKKVTQKKVMKRFTEKAKIHYDLLLKK